MKQDISGFTGQLFCSKEEVTHSCAELILVTQLGTGSKSHHPDFLGDFRS
jgi:hypothetical protein